MSFWLDSVPEFAREQLKSWGLEEKSRGADLVLRILSYPVLPPNVRLDHWYAYPGTMVLLLGEYMRYLYVLSGLPGFN